MKDTPRAKLNLSEAVTLTDHEPRRAPAETVHHQSGATLPPATLGVPKVVSILSKNTSKNTPFPGLS